MWKSKQESLAHADPSCTWSQSSRRRSSTLFHRSSVSSVCDTSLHGGTHNDEEAQGGGYDKGGEQPATITANSAAMIEDDPPSPPRVYRNRRLPVVHKRGNHLAHDGGAKARRNSARCLALCVSAASLVWIITRQEESILGGFEPRGPRSEDRAGRHSNWFKLSTEWMPSRKDQRVTLEEEGRDAEDHPQFPSHDFGDWRRDFRGAAKFTKNTSARYHAAIAAAAAALSAKTMDTRTDADALKSRGDVAKRRAAKTKRWELGDDWIAQGRDGDLDLTDGQEEEGRGVRAPLPERKPLHENTGTEEGGHAEAGLKHAEAPQFRPLLDGTPMKEKGVGKVKPLNLHAARLKPDADDDMQSKAGKNGVEVSWEIVREGGRDALERHTHGGDFNHSNPADGNTPEATGKKRTTLPSAGEAERSTEEGLYGTQPTGGATAVDTSAGNAVAPEAKPGKAPDEQDTRAAEQWQVVVSEVAAAAEEPTPNEAIGDNGGRGGGRRENVVTAPTNIDPLVQTTAANSASANVANVVTIADNAGNANGNTVNSLGSDNTGQLDGHVRSEAVAGITTAAAMAKGNQDQRQDLNDFRKAETNQEHMVLSPPADDGNSPGSSNSKEKAYDVVSSPTTNDAEASAVAVDTNHEEGQNKDNEKRSERDEGESNSNRLEKINAGGPEERAGPLPIGEDEKANRHVVGKDEDIVSSRAAVDLTAARGGAHASGTGDDKDTEVAMAAANIGDMLNSRGEAEKIASSQATKPKKHEVDADDVKERSGDKVSSSSKREKSDAKTVRFNVKPPSRHAARWEQAKGSDGLDNDTSKPSNQQRQFMHSAEAAAKPAAVDHPLSDDAQASLSKGRDGGQGGYALTPKVAGEQAPPPCRFHARVESWEPPATADLRSSYQWRDEQKASMEIIRRFNRGGSSLRDLIHDEVVRLDILRHDLFC